MSRNGVSIRFGAKKRVMYITRMTLKGLGFPSHIQFLFNGKTKTLFLLPCDANVIDSYAIPQWFWNNTGRSGRECEVTRKTLVEAILMKTDWLPNTAYRVDGDYDSENNIAVFRLEEAVRLEQDTFK